MRLDDARNQPPDGARPSSTTACPRRRLRSREKEEVGAPAVWTVPDWASHPILEHFYGHARPARASSFDDVMRSPLNATATTTLGENCCSYKAMDDDKGGRRLATRRPFGSFAYSWTTDTSEEGQGTETVVDDRDALMGASRGPSGSGYAHWNRMRETMTLHGGLVPVPLEPRYPSDKTALTENSPRRGNSASSRLPESPSSSRTSARLRAKLRESLRDMDTRIDEEQKRLRGKKQKKEARSAPANAMWSLICGARTDEASQADGVTLLVEKLGLAVSHRALNQLQRHRRHVSGILQIVTAHNPDLELTERQLDSFEAADAMLANDIKYSVLKQQHKLLVTSLNQRRRAAAQAKLHNGTDCFEIPHVKSEMLSKLLEAVSWYRLVQRNAREEAASSCVGGIPRAGSSVEAAPCSGMQELQVDTILDVLAGEAFYSDFNDLMCQADWWEIAQAHFENLIFSSKTSRICQWMCQLSRDVAAKSYEELEETEQRGLRTRTEAVMGGRMPSKSHRWQASWTEDPPPEQILDFLERLTTRVRREFDVPTDVSKSLNVFLQRTVFARIAVLCLNQKATRECQRKDKLWRKKCVELSGLPMENVGVSPELVAKIRSNLPSHRLHGQSGKPSSQRQVFFVRAIEAFNGMNSVVPCDLLEELMHGVVILHHEAALVLGTTQFSVETFFPLLAYVLVHCRLPTIHAQLHLLENFAITADNANGEESYYVYCVHAAVEYVCNTAGLGGKGSMGTSISSPRCAVATTEGSSFSSIKPMLHTSPSPSPSKESTTSSEPELENAPSDSRNSSEVGVSKPLVSGLFRDFSPTSC